MRKMTAMTDAQWAELAQFREEWYAVGTACGPSDRPATSAAVTALYRAIDLPPPQMLFVPSPMSALVLGRICQRGGQRAGQLKGELWDKLMDQCWGTLWNGIAEKLRNRLWGEIGVKLRTAIWDDIGVHLRDELRGQRGEKLASCLWGQYESPWVAFYSWMPRMGIQYTAWQQERFAAWAALARSCGLWWPSQYVCVVADRPAVLHVDAQRRLHAEEGPAMRFSDGYALWAWHGVRVSQQTIEQPISLDVATIQAEPNTERRRIMIERWGWEQYLEQTGATLRDVDTEPAGAPGLRGLYRGTDGHDVLQVLVCCCASTGRTYALQVPPEIDTCQQAAAWLAGTRKLTLLVRT